jgi:predicted phage-related endonuclease
MHKVVYSSQLATLIGLNKYKSRKKLLFEYFKINVYKCPVLNKPPSNCKIIGIQNESRIIKEFENKYSIKCYPVDKQRIEVNNWIIRGKCDGITSVGSLIEVKCRMKKISDVVESNDYAQIQSYLQIYGVDQCYYVESLYNSNDIHVKIITKDHDFWENLVKPKVKEFDEIYDQFNKCINIIDML